LFHSGIRTASAFRLSRCAGRPDTRVKKQYPRCLWRSPDSQLLPEFWHWPHPRHWGVPGYEVLRAIFGTARLSRIVCGRSSENLQERKALAEFLVNVAGQCPEVFIQFASILPPERTPGCALHPLRQTKCQRSVLLLHVSQFLDQMLLLL